MVDERRPFALLIGLVWRLCRAVARRQEIIGFCMLETVNYIEHYEAPGDKAASTGATNQCVRHIAGTAIQ